MRSMRIPLSWQIVLAAILAIILGYVFPVVAGYAAQGTDIFVKIMSMLIIPYVLCCIISALTKPSDYGFMGRIVLRNLTMFVAMETGSVLIALIISNIIFQNSAIDIENYSSPKIDTVIDFGDFIFKLVPDSITDLFEIRNLPSLIIIACVLGFLINRSSDKSRIFLSNFFTSSNEIMQRLSNIVSAIVPFGLFCIFSKLTIEQDIFASFYKIKPLVIAVLCGLAIHSIVVIPIMLKTIGKCSPFRVMKMFSSEIFTSMSLSSPCLTIPMAINKMKSESGVSSKIADLSMPIISTINSNGTSIFLATGALYVAQAYGINLSIIEQIILMFAVSFITIANVACPLKLSILIYPVLESFGIPIEGMGILIIGELFFGMLCSGADIWSNIAITTTIAASEGDTIKTGIPLENTKD